MSSVAEGIIDAARGGRARSRLRKITALAAVPIAATVAACAGGEEDQTAADASVGADPVAQVSSIQGPVARIERFVGGLPEELGGGPITAFSVGPHEEVVVAGRSGALVRYPGPGEEGRMTTIRRSAAPSTSELPLASAAFETLGLAIDGSGRIWERTEDSLHVYAATGEREAAYPAPEGRPVHGHRSLRVTPGGDVWVGLAPGFPEEGEKISFPRPVFARLDQRGRPVDTLSVPARLAEECPVLSEPHFQSGSFEDLRARYVPKVMWALSPEATLVAGCPAGPTFEVGLTAMPGAGSARSVRLPARPRVPVSSAERVGFVNLWTARMNNAAGEERVGEPGTEGPADDGWSWRGDAIPDIKPVYQDILVGDQGRIWVWRPIPSVPRPTPPDWPLAGLPTEIYTEAPSPIFDVFEPDGTALGVITLPADAAYSPFGSTPPPVFRGDRVWAVRQNPDEAPRVVVIELAPEL